MALTFTNSRGNTYIAHGKEVTMRNQTRTVYFFAKDEREGALTSMPEGFEVSETKNGLPVLKRIRLEQHPGDN